jgi:threonine synthase
VHGSTGKYFLTCVRCEWTCGPSFTLNCPRCAGPVDPRLTLPGAATPRPADHPELVYLDFLPIESRQFIDVGGTVRTPCRPAPALGALIGVPRLWIKDESGQPTGTTKDRLASVVLAVFRQFGIKEWVASSTGNSATALARAVARDDSMRAHFFCGRAFLGDHDIGTSERVTLTAVDGSYADASRAAVQFAGERGLVWEGGFFNWARRGGLKLTYFEIFDQMDVEPNLVVQAISSGIGVMAAYQAAKEYIATGRLAAMPSFLMVQQDTCAPMARAWAEGRAELTDDDVVVDPVGLARAILLGDGRKTYPYMRGIAASTGGGILSVSQGDLVEARHMLSTVEGAEVCYASAATVAAVRNEAAAGRISPDQVVVVNLTGRMRTSAG